MDWDVTHHPAYMQGKKLAYPDVPKEHPKFSQSVVVGNLVFLSGCVGLDMATGATPQGVAGQVNQALDNVRAALETAGSSMENIVKTFFLIKSLDNYGEVRKTETEYYEKHAPKLVETPPSATLMVVPSLAAPEFELEYEVIAAVDRSAADWGVTYYPEYWGGKELAYPHVPKDHAKFARTQVVGKFVAVSGCQALDHDTVRVETDDFAEQTRISLDKIKVGLEETGGSLNTLVKTNVFIKDLNELEHYREIEHAYFKEHAPALAANPPASTVIVVDELPRPVFLVEVEAFGVAGEDLSDWPTTFRRRNQYVANSVTAGNLLYVSGCDGADPNTGAVISDDAEQQMIAAFDQTRSAIEEADGSMNGIVKTLMMLRRLEDYPTMRRVEFEYYEKHAPGLIANPPASTFVQLPAITSPDTLFQIDVTAVL